jgi:aspartate aminotransferase-like enzyme
VKKIYNFVPGPTPVPDRVTARMAAPILTHRSSEFTQLLARVSEDLKYLFQTQHEVLILTASGTGAMEAAVVSLLAPGDRVAVIRAGKFGGRWVELCETYGAAVTVIDVAWGAAVDPGQVADTLARAGRVEAVFATHSETSTGVLHDIEAIGRVVKDHGSLFVVDAVSGLGANELRPDDWHVDVVVTGSQKGLMLPPGLAFISVSPRAWEYAHQGRIPSYYLNLVRAREALHKGTTPYTPAVSLIMGLDEALQTVRSISLEGILAHHARLASATRAGVNALGLSLFAQRPSNVLTSVALPPDMDGNALLKTIKTECGVIIANGMEQYRGRTLRIAHLGYAVSPFDMLVAISALEHGLARMGHPFEPGAGVAAVQRAVMSNEG